MRKVVAYAAIVPAFFLFASGVSLTHLGMWVHLGGRWLWREHDKFLDWFHWELCGPTCPHKGKRDE